MKPSSTNRDIAVDRPTIGLTGAEHEAFRRLAGSIEHGRPRRGRPRRWAHEMARRVEGLSLLGTALCLAAGSTWLLAWLTTNVVVSALALAPLAAGVLAGLRLAAGSKLMRYLREPATGPIIDR